MNRLHHYNVNGMWLTVYGSQIIVFSYRLWLVVNGLESVECIFNGRWLTVLILFFVVYDLLFMVYG